MNSPSSPSTSSPSPGSPQRLYLHIGLPKSGTTHLQALLASHRQPLRQAGFRYPFVRPEAMFHAAVELRSQGPTWGLSEELITGTWDQLLRRVRGAQGEHGIISHELLAGSSPTVIERIRRDTADLELHLVVTSRDPVRQAVAYWQEEVKNGRSWSFADFEETLGRPTNAHKPGSGFWRSQDLAGVLARWSAIVPPERVHVVTVPGSGGDPSALVRRFEEAIGIPAGLLDTPVADSEPATSAANQAANQSLGTHQIALMRAVLTSLDGRIAQPAYAHVVKRWFAQRLLAAQRSPRPVPPPSLVEALTPVAHAWVETLTTGGYRVVGDPRDLVPAPATEGPHPDDVSAEDLVAQVPDLLGELLIEVARLRAELAEATRREARPATTPLPRRLLAAARRRLRR